MPPGVKKGSALAPEVSFSDTQLGSTQMIFDLSHKLAPDMPAYPGLPTPKFHVFLAHGDAGKHAYYSPGTSFQIASLRDRRKHRHLPRRPVPSSS